MPSMGVDFYAIEIKNPVAGWGIYNLWPFI
jgi:hypothetical protein